MIDNCAGASVFPVGYDPAALADASVLGVTLQTANGEEVHAYDGKQSTFRLPTGPNFTVSYNEAEHVQRPIVSVAEAAAKGNWFVFGPGTQLMVADSAGAKHLAEALRLYVARSVPLVKDQGVYWLDCHAPEKGDPVFPLRPTHVAREAKQPAQAPGLSGTAPVVAGSSAPEVATSGCEAGISALPQEAPGARPRHKDVGPPCGT